MPEVVTSISAAAGRGVFIIYKAVLAAITAVGTGRAAMVAYDLPWGPLDEETSYSDAATFRKTFAPAGFTRTGQAYLMATRFPWIDLQIVRILGNAPAKATINAQKAGALDCVQLPAKYFGTGGNGITAVVSAASDANADHFDLTVQKMDAATGLNTTEVYLNVDSTQTDAAYWSGITAASDLLGPLVKSSVGRPVNGTYTLAAGTNGAAVGSANYLGTPGSADKGIALLENDADVSFVFTDDPASGIHAAVMAGIKSHCVFMKDRRVGILMGLPAETVATAKTNVALNKDSHCVYVYPHCKVLDDQGNKVVIPLSGPLASFATLLTPHLSCAYKSKDFTKALSNIVELDASTASKSVRIELEKVGVMAFEKNKKSGHFSPYNDITTDAVTPLFVTRMSDYIAFSIAERLEDFRGAPNDTETQEDERTLIKSFLKEMYDNKKIDHIFRPCIDGYEQLPLEATNTQAQLDAGDITHGAKVKIISEQKRIFLSIEAGTSVKVTMAAA